MARSTRHVALLRGINLASRNRVSMPRLRATLAARGFEDVVTHGQSGNVLLTSAQPPATVAAAVEDCLADDLGVVSKVVVRSLAEVAEAVAADPLADVADDPSRHFIVFLSRAPDKAKTRELLELDVAPDRLAFGRREAYMWCPRGLRASKLGRLDFDERLGVVATSRNARTVDKLLELGG